MSDIELEVDRQVLLPGETLTGVVRTPGASGQVKLTLRGEEAFRPYVGWDSVTSIHEQTLKVDCKKGDEGPTTFSFVLPEDLNPSYSSETLRCTYSLKATRPRSLFGRQGNHLHLSVIPRTVDYEKAPHALLIESKSLKIDVLLDHVSLEAGEPLTGSFLLTRLDPEGALPLNVTISLACIEEAPTRQHRKVLWRIEESVQPTAEMTYPLRGAFEFPTAASSPTTGKWKTFKVHTGFRFRVDWGDHNQRESLPIQLFHPLRLQEPGRLL